ncbi:hypothetical protein H0H92_003217 [Tricholoma furcatifolium]|nr:hypothetical protein H0H92_003217 [Tricholoma furcatifolium]
MSVTYGIEVQEENDPYLTTAELALKSLADVVFPGRYLVEFIPLLKYVPSWAPGFTFKRMAKEYRDYPIRMVEDPFNAVQRDIAQNKAVAPSFVSNCLYTMDPNAPSQDQLRIIQETAGALYEGNLIFLDYEEFIFTPSQVAQIRHLRR